MNTEILKSSLTNLRDSLDCLYEEGQVKYGAWSELVDWILKVEDAAGVSD